MSTCFKVEENVLTISYEPVNGATEFASICLQLLNSEYVEVIVEVNRHITSLSSVYMGTMISNAVLASHMHKKFLIKCSQGLKNWLQVIGGSDLMEFIETE